MNVFQLLPEFDPRLRQVSEPVEQFGEALLDFVQTMQHTMRAHDGVGLAAPQVGVNYRIIVVQLDGQHFLPAPMVNPRITKADGEQSNKEGCLSVSKDKWGSGFVRRAKRVVVEYQDLTGVSRKRKLQGLLAAIVQHEIDHLNGVLFTDRLT